MLPMKIFKSKWILRCEERVNEIYVIYSVQQLPPMSQTEIETNFYFFYPKNWMESILNSLVLVIIFQYPIFSLMLTFH